MSTYFFIEFLENVKYTFFDIPNVHFLLSMDLQALESTVKNSMDMS